MADKWHELLYELREKEIARTFQHCPVGAFESGLELGAGNGYQSNLLKRYVHSLTSTDLNAERLPTDGHEDVRYMVCDAERVDAYFAAHSFDLVFASNLFEHLPQPAEALRAIEKVLKPGGIVILIMPNVLWKALSLLGFYPHVLRMVARSLIRPDRWWHLLRRYILSPFGHSHPSPKGNNLKSGEERPFTLGSLFLPKPHGAYGGHIAEFRSYNKYAWLRLFEKNGFTPACVLKGPVSSGYGFGLDALRASMERMGMATEYIYVIHRVGEVPSAIRYWNSVK